MEATVLDNPIAKEILAKPGTARMVHFSTLTVIKRIQESWGDRITQEVLISWDPKKEAPQGDWVLAIDKVIRKRYPFNPGMCTNQHSPGKVIFATNFSSGHGIYVWEVYHSIGD